MEVVSDEGIKELVKDELSKLGIHDSPMLDAKKPSYGTKLLTRTVTGTGSKAAKGRKKELDSSKESPTGMQENSKNNPKSPFSKNRNSIKKKTLLQHQSKVFGVGLSESPQSNVTLPDGNCVQVPQFLVDCCNLLRNHITLEGIFRKAGSASRQNEIKRLVDSGNNLPTNMHPIDAACLIKQFFRCLPHPLLESSIHTRMLRCLMTLEEGEPRISGLTLCSLLLPSPSQHSLVYFLNFLDEVVQHSSSNRMDAYNLAVVLSPNLLPLTLGSTIATGHLAQSSKKNKLSTLAITDDNIIAANIGIMQELIRHQHRMCRLPSDVLAGLLQEQQLRAAMADQGSDSTDGPAVAAVPKSKKRRSASIHRLMSGLRRVVGAQSLPMPAIPNPNSPHPLHQHRITRPASPLVSALQRHQPASSPLLLFSPSRPPLSLHPSGDGDQVKEKSPGKRKSDVLLPSDEGTSDQPKKKARVTPAGEAPVQRRSSSRLSYAAAVAASPRMAPPQTTAGSGVIKVRRSATARESSSGPRLSFPRHPSLAEFVDSSAMRSKKRSLDQRRSLNSNLGDRLAGMGEKLVVKSEKLVSADSFKHKTKPTLILYPYVDQDTSSKSASVKANSNSAEKEVLQEKNTELKAGNASRIPRDGVPYQMRKSKSEVTSITAHAPMTPLKTNKINDGQKFRTTPNLDELNKFSVTTPASGRRSGAVITPLSSGGFTPRHSSGRISKRARRKARNARLASLSEPDGEPVSTPNRPPTRGEPDGAERTLRDPSAVEVPTKSGNNTSELTTLESQYDTIKGAVAKMEKQINDDALDELKRSLFGDEEITSIASLNHNEIIQSAYDRMEKESNMLGMSPSENLSRRLDRELKIRRRRSGENCVVRSPSARKIGTIRRRSKELELKCQQGNISILGHETPSVNKSARTPRLKEPLLKSPLSHSLKRGRPNSVRCGLPFVVRRVEAEASLSCNKIPFNRSSISSSSTSGAETEENLNSSVKDGEKPSQAMRDVNSEGTPSLPSPGNMDDHALPSVNPGVTLDSTSQVVDVDNEQWLPASDFLEEVESQANANDIAGDDVTPAGKQKDGNRPSIAALKKQKKVTANVQLFNQLGCVTPSLQRRQSRSCATPAANGPALPRPAVSERRQQQQRSRYSTRASLTPRHFNNTALRYHQPRVVAIVSPLKENIVNITPSTSTSKTQPDHFKTPGPPSMTPLSSRRKGPARVSSVVLDSPTKVKRESLF